MPKEKLTLYLEHEQIAWLDSKTNPELKVSAVVRNLIRDKMNVESRRKAKKNPFSTGLDPFSFYVINEDVIPDDLQEYSDLLIEWWPIRKKKGGSCTTSVAERIFKKLRSFPTQDRKQALENAIAGGWKDLFPLKQSYKPEEPEFKPKYLRPVIMIYHQHLLKWVKLLKNLWKVNYENYRTIKTTRYLQRSGDSQIF